MTLDGIFVPPLDTLIIRIIIHDPTIHTYIQYSTTQQFRACQVQPRPHYLIGQPLLFFLYRQRMLIWNNIFAFDSRDIYADVGGE